MNILPERIMKYARAKPGGDATNWLGLATQG